MAEIEEKKQPQKRPKKIEDQPVKRTRKSVATKSEEKAAKSMETITETKSKADSGKNKKQILFVSSEAAPFITTGGLGEVIGALPKALHQADPGLDVRIIIPLYEEVVSKFSDKLEFLTKMYVDLSWRHQYCGVYTANVNGVTYYFIDNEYYFKRADCYGFFDDGERFAFFGKAVLAIIEAIGFIPDIIHTHDWQSALVNIYLRTTHAWNEKFRDTKTIFTIHNIEYQGRYTLAILHDIFDIPYHFKDIVEFDGQINLMKGAIMCSDIISTVSPTYAKEIHDSYYAYGLSRIINIQTSKMRGILNGIDTESYNPETDIKIYQSYNADDISGKIENKLHLQNKLNLPADESIPMVVMITRLVRHKGIDLVVGAMNKLVTLPIQFVILGKGDREYELQLESFAESYPDKVRAVIKFDNEMSRKIYAAADMLLVPSKFEPCGITQMIASRYGAVPLVRETGGLKDSIIPYETGNGIGFTFYDYVSDNIVDVIERALNVYNDSEKWNALVNKVIRWDFSWENSAKEYIKMYKEL